MIDDTINENVEEEDRSIAKPQIYSNEIMAAFVTDVLSLIVAVLMNKELWMRYLLHVSRNKSSWHVAQIRPHFD